MNTPTVTAPKIAADFNSELGDNEFPTGDDLAFSRGTDFYRLDELLTDREREIRDRVRAWCDTEVVPAAAGYWERAEFPVEPAKGYGRLGIGNEWVLDGQKRWIGNGTVADVVIVWARDDDGQVGAFVVEHPDGAAHPVPGYHARKIVGKAANRGVWQAQIRLDGVRVPADARLAKSRTWDDTNFVLGEGRQTVAWEALGDMRCRQRL